jgi:ElaB/YqjD/DUF883 family membrane-anchored ribosome-binding protein
MSQEQCINCKRTREHVAAILPFQVIEKIVDKPLRIRGVAMTAGVSRNFNIYTADELQAFAPKLVGAPLYIEHVAVQNSIGKVTKTEWIAPNLWYEAEVYDDQVAEQIRKGLIQHVSVGADYTALDVVDGKVPHGLHNAELSLVAVPGIPEANVQVLETLRESLREQGFEPMVAGEYILGFYQDPALFLPEHFRIVWLDQANGVLAVMAKNRVDPAKELCQSVLFLKSKWQPNTVKDWLVVHPDYLVLTGAPVVQGTPSGVEKLDEKELEKLAEKIAAIVVEKNAAEVKRLTEELDATKTKLSETEGKLAEAQRMVEQMKTASSGAGLVKDQPKTIPIAEAVSILEGLLPSPTVERSTLGMMRECQEIRGAIFKLRERLKVA